MLVVQQLELLLYLCDDGKDAAKADFIASLGDKAQ
jgi:hypothetical protein